MKTIAVTVLLAVGPLYAAPGQNYASMQDAQGRSFSVVVDPATGGALRVFAPSVHLSDHGIDHENLHAQAIDRLTGQLLDDFRPILKLDAHQVQLQRTDTDGEMWFVSYRQIHQGVPVEWTEIGYSISPDGEVISLGGRSYPRVEVITVPTLSSMEAIDLAKQAFNEHIAKVRDDAELVILPVDTGIISFQLVWKVGLFSSRPLRYVNYYIDAHHGDVVRTINNVRDSHSHFGPRTTELHDDHLKDDKPSDLHKIPHFPGITAGDYVPLPLTLQGTITGDYADAEGNMRSAPFATTNMELVNVIGRLIKTSADANGEYSIGGLTPGLYRLRIPLESDWVKLYDVDEEVYTTYQRILTGTVVQLNHNWSGGIPGAASDASNVRYHAHAAHDFFAAAPLNFDLGYQMSASVNRGPLVNGAADGRRIQFGSANDQEWAMASDVVYHEYTHNVVFAIYGGFIAANSGGDYFSQAKAMDEGLADYFSTSITDDPNFGEDVGVNRNLDNTLKWSPWRGGHWNGQVIGGVLWDIRLETGFATADHLALKAMQISPKAYNFADFGYNLILADNHYNAGVNETSIRDALDNHEISVLSPPAPEVVSIAGPDSLISLEVGTWTAVVPETADSLQTYRWEYVLLCAPSDSDRGRGAVACDTWAFGSSGSSYSRMANSSYDLKIKLTVTYASSNQETASKTVRTVNPSGSNFVKQYGMHGGQSQVLVAEPQALQVGYALNRNYPNPFNSSTEIQFSLSTASKISLVVYDMTGRVVAELLNGSLEAGSHSVTFSAPGLPSGTYIYRLQAGDFAERQLMTLLK